MTPYPKCDEPPFMWRLWKCWTNPRAWMTRVKIDKAIDALLTDGGNEDLAYKLWDVSDRLWDEAFKGYEAPRVSFCKLTLRWAFLGWWAVPTLYGMRFLAEIQESYWTTDGSQVHWHTDEGMTKAIQWINEFLCVFFPSRIPDL